MAVIAEFEELFSDWIAAVTGAIDRAAGHLLRPRLIWLDEHEDGTFTASADASKGAPGLAAISFSLADGSPSPPLSPEWVAALRGSRIELELPSSQVMESPLDFPSR